MNGLYNNNKTYFISQNNIVSKLKAVDIEKYINLTTNLKPAKDNFNPFVCEYGSNIVQGLCDIRPSGIWESSQKYDTNCSDKDFQQEYFFTFWKISNRNVCPSLGSLDWYVCNENPINLMKLIKRQKNVSKINNQRGIIPSYKVGLAISKLLL